MSFTGKEIRVKRLHFVTCKNKVVIFGGFSQKIAKKDKTENEKKV